MRFGADIQSHGSGKVDLTREGICLSDVVATYLRLKGQDKVVTFHRAAERSCGYVIDVCGDKPLTGYTKSDANSFRDALIARGMAGSSITRIFGTVRSIINFAASEEGIELTNPFGKVYYDRTAGVSHRKPIPADAIRVALLRNSRLRGDCPLPR